MWLDNSLARWLVALGVAGGAYWGLLLLRRAGVDCLRRLAERKPSHLDDLLVDLALRTQRFFLLVVAISAAGRVLVLSEAVALGLRQVGWLAFFVQTGVWVDYGLGFALRRQIERRGEGEPAHRAAFGLMAFFARVAVWSVVALLALDNLGVDVTALVAGLGVGGILAGLALQNVLKDTFASLAIVLDKPFELGDTIKVGDFVGTVTRIGIKTTRLRSVDGEELVFGNDDLLTSRIQNFGRLRERRATLRFGVSYSTPPEKLEAIPTILREIVEAQDGPRFERAHFKEFGVSSLEFECVYWVLDPAYSTFMDVRQRVQLELCRRLAKAGIEFPAAAWPIEPRPLTGHAEPLKVRRPPSGRPPR